MKTIATARVRLRPMERSDLRVLHGFYADPELMRFITGRPRTPWETRSRLRKDLRHHREFGFGLCIAEWREDGTVIGRCGLEPVQGPAGLEGEAAWMFAKRWWGRGLASEVGAALISSGLDDLGLSRVFAVAHIENAPSIRVMKKLGMREVEQRGDELVYEIRR